jgi:hypothetical protein
LAQRRSILDFVPYDLQAAVMDSTSTELMSTYLQDALDSMAEIGGGELEVTNGLYRFNTPLYVPSNTTICGGGRLLAVPAEWSPTGPAASTDYYHCGFLNKNFLTEPVDPDNRDHDIAIEGLTIGMAGLGVDPETGGSDAHAWLMRFVDRAQARFVTVRNSGNATSFLACRDTLVIGCHAEGMANAFFDHWEGAGYAKVIGCVGRGSNAQGIQFTGVAATPLTDDSRSAVCVVAHNQLYGVRSPSGYAAAIIANANGVNAQDFDFKSIGNYVEDCDIGLAFTGMGGRHESLSDTFRDVDRAPVYFQNEGGSRAPSHCRISNPKLIDCGHAPGNGGLIVLDGPSTGHIVEGVQVIRTATGTAPYDYIVALRSGANDAYVDVRTAPSGVLGRVSDLGTGNRVFDYDPASLKAWSVRGYLAGPATAPMATAPGDFVSVNVGGTTTFGASRGHESIGSSYGAGYGWKWATYDAGGGVVRYGFGYRSNSAVWEEKGYITPTQFNLVSGLAYAINGVPVLSGQGAAVPNLASGASTEAVCVKLNELLDQLRAIQLIAT